MNGASWLEKVLCPSPNSARMEGTVTPSQAAASRPHPGGAAGQQGGIFRGRDAQGPCTSTGKRPTLGTFVSSWSSLPLGLDSASLAAASCFFHSSMSCSAFLGEAQGGHAELGGSAVVLREHSPPPSAPRQSRGGSGSPCLTPTQCLHRPQRAAPCARVSLSHRPPASCVAVASYPKVGSDSPLKTVPSQPPETGHLRPPTL